MDDKKLASELFLHYVGASWRFDIAEPDNHYKCIDNIRFNRVGKVTYTEQDGVLRLPEMIIQLPDSVHLGNGAEWEVFKLNTPDSNIFDFNALTNAYNTGQASPMIDLFEQYKHAPRLITSQGKVLPLSHTTLIRDEMCYNEAHGIAPDTFLNAYAQNGVESDYYLATPAQSYQGSASYVSLHVISGVIGIPGYVTVYNPTAGSPLDNGIHYADGEMLPYMTTAVPEGVTFLTSYEYTQQDYFTLTDLPVVIHNDEPYYLATINSPQIAKTTVFHFRSMVWCVRNADYTFTDLTNIRSIQITHQAYLLHKGDIDERTKHRPVVIGVYPFTNRHVYDIVPERHHLDHLYELELSEIVSYLKSNHPVWGYKELASSIITQYADPYYEWAFKLSFKDWLDELGFGSVLSILGKRVLQVTATESGKLTVKIPPLYRIDAYNTTSRSIQLTVLVRKLDGTSIDVVENLVADENFLLDIPTTVTVGEDYLIELLENNGSVVLVCPSLKPQYVDRWQRDYSLYVKRDYGENVFDPMTTNMHKYVNHVMINGRHFIQVKPTSRYILLIFGTVQNHKTTTAASTSLTCKITDIVGDSLDLKRIEPGMGEVDHTWGLVDVTGNTFAIPEDPGFPTNVATLPYQHNISAMSVNTITYGSVLCNNSNYAWLEGGIILVTFYSKTIQFINTQTGEIKYYQPEMEHPDLLSLPYILTRPSIIGDLMVYVSSNYYSPVQFFVSKIKKVYDEDGRVVDVLVPQNYSDPSEVQQSTHTLISHSIHTDNWIGIQFNGVSYANTEANTLIAESKDQKHWIVIGIDSTNNTVYNPLYFDNIQNTSVCLDDRTGELFIVDNANNKIYSFLNGNYDTPEEIVLTPNEYNNTTWQVSEGILYGVRADGMLFKSRTPISSAPTLAIEAASGYLLKEEVADNSKYEIGEVGKSVFLITETTPTNDAQLYICKWPAGRPILTNVLFEFPTGKEKTFNTNSTAGANIAITGNDTGRLVIPQKHSRWQNKLNTSYSIFDLTMDYIVPGRVFSESIPHPVASYMSGISIDDSSVVLRTTLDKELFRDVNGDFFKPTFLKLSYSVDIPDYTSKRVYANVVNNNKAIPFLQLNKTPVLNSNLKHVFGESQEQYDSKRLDDTIKVGTQSFDVNDTISVPLTWETQSSIIKIPLTDPGLIQLNESDDTFQLYTELSSYKQGFKLMPKLGIYAVRKDSILEDILNNTVLSSCSYVRAFVEGVEVSQDSVNKSGYLSTYSGGTVTWLYGNMFQVSYAELTVNSAGNIVPVSIQNTDYNLSYIDGFTLTNVNGKAVDPLQQPVSTTSGVFSMYTYLPPNLLHILGIDQLPIDELIAYLATVREHSYGPWVTT